MCRTTRSPGASMSMRNIVAPPRSPGCPEVRAMQIVYAAPSAPVMNHFRPLTSQPPGVGVAVVARAAGSEPAPGRRLGHREARPHRALRRAAAGSAPSAPRRRDRLEQVHVALVGRRDVEGERAEQRPARLLEDHGPAAHVQAVSAVLLGDVRREHPGLARRLLETQAQLLAAVARDAAEPLLLGGDDRAHEVGGARGQVGDGRVGGQLDRSCRSSSQVLVRRSRPARAHGRRCGRPASPRAAIRSSELSPRRCRT